MLFNEQHNVITRDLIRQMADQLNEVGLESTVSISGYQVAVRIHARNADVVRETLRQHGVNTEFLRVHPTAFNHVWDIAPLLAPLTQDFYEDEQEA